MADCCVSRVPVFASLSAQDQQRVEELARPTRLKAGEAAYGADDDLSALAPTVAGDNDKVKTTTRPPGSSDSCPVHDSAASLTAERPDLPPIAGCATTGSKASSCGSLQIAWSFAEPPRQDSPD